MYNFDTIIKEKSEIIENEYEKIGILTIDLNLNIPDNFNGLDIWKKYLSPVLNQGNCGSCWAFASVSTLSDRFNILSKGQLNLSLSPIKLLLCNWRVQNIFSKINIDNKKYIEESACFGNSLVKAYTYLTLYGTTTNKCTPYNRKKYLKLEFESLEDFKENKLENES